MFVIDIPKKGLLGVGGGGGGGGGPADGVHGRMFKKPLHKDIFFFCQVIDVRGKGGVPQSWKSWTKTSDPY